MKLKTVLFFLILITNLNLGFGQTKTDKVNQLVYPFSFTMDLSEENDKYGLISSNNIIILEPSLKDIEPFQNQSYNSFTTYKRTAINGDVLVGIVTNTGLIIDELESENLTYNQNGKYVEVKQGKNEMIINMITMDTISNSDTASLKQVIVGEEYFLIMQHKEKGHYFFFDENGKRLSNVNYEFELNHRWINKGIPIFRTKFNYKNSRYVDPYGKSYNQLELNLAKSIIPKTRVRSNVKKVISEESIIALVDKETLGYIFQTFYPGKVSFVSLKKRKKLALANEEGQLVTDCIYDEFIPIQTDFYKRGRYSSDNYIICKKGEKLGLVDTEGKQLLEPIFDIIDFDFNIKMFYVSIGNYSGYCSKEGKVYLPSICNCY